MKVQHKNLLALILFACSLVFLIAASNSQKAELLTGECYHCGTASACLNGGQAYGYFDCHYDPELAPPNNCSPMGGSGCGTDPGEHP